MLDDDLDTCSELDFLGTKQACVQKVIHHKS